MLERVSYESADGEIVLLKGIYELNQNSDLVSIIVPVYNVEPYLKECLLSLVGQTYRNLEIILVDDGSTDRSGIICDYFAAQDLRIKVIHIEKQGVSSARNIGINNASGQWISFVDSDDFAHSGMIEYLLNGAKKYQALIVIGDTATTETSAKEFSFDEDADTCFEKMTCLKVLENILNNKIRKSVWGMLFNAELIKTSCFTEGCIYEDLPYLPLVMKSRPKTIWGDKVIYVQRMNPTSITHQKINRQSSDRIKMKELQVQRIAQYFPELEALAIGGLYADCLIWKIKADEAEDMNAGNRLNKEIERCLKLHPITLNTLTDPKLSVGRRASLVFSLISFNATCKVKKVIIKMINK